MSVENVKKFYEVLSRDKEMQQKFIDLKQKYQGQSMAEAATMEMLETDLLPLARQQGYEISVADLQAYGEAMKQAGMNRELSDEELAAVSGGTLICKIGLGYSYDYIENKNDGYCCILGFDDAGNCCVVIGGLG